MRSRIIYLTLIAISLSVAFAVIEIGLRVAGVYAPIDDPIKAPQPELYEASTTVGYRLHPSLRTTFRYPKTSKELIPLVSNSDGFRNSREFNEPDDRRRVLVVGDSFVFGPGVRAEDRLTEQLELLQPQWRVDNMGMTGWGLDLMLRAIEEYARKAKPDVIVLTVYTDDFRRLLPYYAGAGYAYPKFELRGSELVTTPFPYPRFWERLRVVQLLYQARWRLTRNRYDLNEALLNRYLKDSETIGAKPVVAFFPGTGDSKEDRQRRAFLRDWATRNSVPYLDLTDAMLGAGAQKVYITDNWHWNPAGHRIAAEQLRNTLSRLQSLSALDHEPHE